MVLTASLKIFAFLPFSVAKGLEICIITRFMKYRMHSMFHNVRITVRNEKNRKKTSAFNSHITTRTTLQ